MLEVFTRIAPVVRINTMGQVIRVSGEHRVYARDRDFIEVFQLKPGDEFRCDDGRWLPVDSIEDRGEVVQVSTSASKVIIPTSSARPTGASPSGPTTRGAQFREGRRPQVIQSMETLHFRRARHTSTNSWTRR